MDLSIQYNTKKTVIHMKHVQPFMLVIILKLVDHNRTEVINAIRKIIQSAV